MTVSPGPARRTQVPLDWLVPTVVLLLVAVVGIVLIAGLGQLGYDEAVYASKARSYISDTPVDWWELYRPPGIALFGTLAGAAGLSDASLRVVTLFGGLATLAIVWLVARQLWDASAALFAILGAVGAPVVLSELPLFHNDIASAGLLLLLMWILWDQFAARPAPNRMLLLAAVVAAAAFYVRYGIAVGIVGIGVATLLLWGSRLLAHARLVGLTVLLGVVLFLPHLVLALSTTGSPIGIVTAAGEQVNTTGPRSAFRAYRSWVVPSLFGSIPFALAVAGLIHAGALALSFAFRRTGASQLRRQLWLLVPAAVSAVLIVLVSHAEPRYMLFPVLLTIISGAGALSAAISLVARPFAHRARAVRVMGTLVVAIGLAGWAGRVATSQIGSADGQPAAWKAAGERIAGDADGPCRVIATQRPLIGWYTTCEIVRMDGQPAAAARAAPPTRTYVVFTDRDADRVGPTELAAYRDLALGATELPPRTGVGDTYEVYRLEP